MTKWTASGPCRVSHGVRHTVRVRRVRRTVLHPQGYDVLLAARMPSDTRVWYDSIFWPSLPRFKGSRITLPPSAVFLGTVAGSCARRTAEERPWKEIKVTRRELTERQESLWNPSVSAAMRGSVEHRARMKLCCASAVCRVPPPECAGNFR